MISAERTNCLIMAIFIQGIVDALIDFSENKISDPKEFKVRIRAGAELILQLGSDYDQKLNELSQYSLPQQTYTFGPEPGSLIHFEHHEVFGQFVAGHQYKDKLADIRAECLSLLDQTVRRVVPKRCIIFFAKLESYFLRANEFYEPGMPKGIDKLATQNVPAVQSR